MRVNDWIATADRVVSVTREEEVRVLAASLAFYMFNSLVPLLLLVFVGLSLVGNLGLLADTVELLTNVESRRLEQLFKSVTRNAPTRRRAILLALAILVWSSVRLFIALDSAFAIVYGNRDSRSITGTIVQIAFVSAAIMIAIGILISVGIALTFVLEGNELLLVSALTFLLLFMVFLPVFYIFPKGSVALRDVLPGVTITALFWGISGIAFRLYSTSSPSIKFYGAIGGLLLLLTWLYLGGLVLVLGIILNGVLADSPEIQRS